MIIAVGGSLDCGSRAFADQFGGASANLRPVPKYAGSQVQNRQPAANVASAGLQWRSSGEVSQPAAVVKPAGATTAASKATAAANGPVVRQAQFQLPGAAPSAIPGALQAPSSSDIAEPDFFATPIGDLPEPAAPAAVEPDVAQPQLGLPQSPAVTPERRSSDPAANGSGQSNGLREHLESPQPVPLAPAPAQPDSLQLRPAPRADLNGAGVNPADDFQMPRSPSDRRPATSADAREDLSLIRPVAYSCDDFRQSIADATIQNVSLDISPPFRPDVIEQDEFVKLKQRFDESQKIRDWQSIDGRKLGRGRLRDLAYEKVIIETEFGTTEELPVNRISEADLDYISSNWGLPKECLIDQPQYQPRQWQRSKVTWKASNLVHNPLYFEDVNLERYGHTRGPILQPVVSSAHFFANIAVLPYKMGVHLPNECQYALGYYRPGDCAPWIKQPIPISLRGAIFQAGAVGAAVALIP